MFAAAVKGTARAFAAEQHQVNRALQKAQIRAQNRALTQARKEASKEIRTDTRVKAGYVRRKLVLVKARRGDPVARMRVAYDPLPLSQVPGTRQTKKGVRFQAIKTRPRTLIPSGFRATMPRARADQERQHTGFFRRRKVGAGFVERLPIVTLHAPPLIDRFEDHLPVIQDRALEIFEQRLVHEVDFALGKIPARTR